MKRSKVVNYIANMFYEQNVDPEEADELGEEVLSKLEEFGMLPPNRLLLNGRPFGDEYYMFLKGFTWEKEDE